MMSGDPMEKMKERLSIFSREREATKRLLESAVDSLGFSVVVDEEFSFHALFEECADLPEAEREQWMEQNLTDADLRLELELMQAHANSVAEALAVKPRA